MIYLQRSGQLACWIDLYSVSEVENAVYLKIIQKKFNFQKTDKTDMNEYLTTKQYSIARGSLFSKDCS